MGRLSKAFQALKGQIPDDFSDKTPDPLVFDPAARSDKSTGRAILPQTWHSTYGEHNARELLFFTYKCPSLYSAIKVIREAKNGRGYEWVEEYAAYCPKCNKEFPTLPNPKLEGEEDQIDNTSDRNLEAIEQTPKAMTQDEEYVCDDCGGKLELPDPAEYREADELLRKPLPGKRISFSHLQNVHDRDVFSLGNGYYVLKYQYHLKPDGRYIEDNDDTDSNGRKVGRTPIGITHAPEQTVIRIEDSYGHEGGLYYVCLHCRTTNADYRPNKTPGKCIHCKTRETYDVTMISSPDGLRTEGDGCQYYIDGEWFWTPFDPDSLRTCFAPVEVISDQAWTLILQYRQFQRMLEGQASHSIIKWVRTRSVNGFKRFLNKIKMLFKSKEEFWMAASDEASGDPVGVVKMEYTPKELDAIAYKEELVNEISVVYGVMPSSRGSTEGGGGLGNDSMDWTIETNRKKSYQDATNDGFFTWYAKDIWGIRGWKLRHVPPEPQDGEKKAQRSLLWLQAVEAALNVGHKVKQREDMDEYEPVILGDPYTPEEFQGNKSLFNDMGFGGEGEVDESMGDGDFRDNWGGPDGEGSPDAGPEMKAWLSYTDPSKVPKGAKTKKGKRGGKYYWAEKGEGKEDTPKDTTQDKEKGKKNITVYNRQKHVIKKSLIGLDDYMNGDPSFEELVSIVESDEYTEGTIKRMMELMVDIGDHAQGDPNFDTLEDEVGRLADSAGIELESGSMDDFISDAESDKDSNDEVDKLSSKPEYQETLAMYLKGPNECPMTGQEKGEPVDNGPTVFKDDYGSHRYIYYKDKKPVAVMQVMSRDGKTGMIQNIYTEPEHRKTGLMKELHNHANKHFKKLTVTDMVDSLSGKTFKDSVEGDSD